MSLDYCLCVSAAVPMRAEASHRSEMVSQLLFGETAYVAERADDWLRVHSEADDYEGWVPVRELLPLGVTDHERVSLWSGVTQQPVNKVLIAREGMEAYECRIGAGCRVPEGGEEAMLERVEVTLLDSAHQLSLMEVAGGYLGAPYLWGGKTLMGIDCSGFTQSVFRTQGILLMRDAYQQAEMGEEVQCVSDAQAGDLMFFCDYVKGSGRVTHVGIYMGMGRIIHSSATVHVDRVDDEGVYSDCHGCYTHRLLAIRRLVAG